MTTRSERRDEDILAVYGTDVATMTREAPGSQLPPAQAWVSACRKGPNVLSWNTGARPRLVTEIK
jgi:hypothetical protein